MIYFNDKAFKLICAFSIAFTLSGCGNRFFSPRSTNPLIEDRVRLGGTENGKMSVLTSRADRRTILVFGERQVCAEPSPDVAEAVYSQAAGELAAKGVNVGASQTLQTAVMQLTRRSQGLEMYRSGSFVNCMMYYNGALTADQYVDRMDRLFQETVKLTREEIEHLPEIASTILQVSNPQSNTPNVDSIGGQNTGS
ncbi:hypothetical protein [uncultured Erythrobacter sp.]|uniref:hypothetical protein n=1 Tax=uncultured Erythrobacter sp. TaxID=263913 RepID=UPI002625AFD9|nr:hypothetical protein [uncultured Erythrobacter sp.]